MCELFHVVEFERKARPADTRGAKRMDSLPNEIIHMIAAWLLPRARCCFALTARYFYDSLDSPLLRWAAKWAAIEIPKYAIRTDKLSLLEVNCKLVFYRTQFYDITAYNLTQNIYHAICTKNVFGIILIDIYIEKICLSRFDNIFLMYSAEFFMGFYKYMYKDYLSIYYLSKSSKLLDYKIYKLVSRYLNMTDSSNIMAASIHMDTFTLTIVKRRDI